MTHRTMILLAAVAPLLAACEVDCPALYESSLARQCMTYGGNFEYCASAGSAGRPGLARRQGVRRLTA
jgi:hypothetical protein